MSARRTWSQRRRQRYTPPQVSENRPRRPYPNGWFAVGFSADVPPGSLRRSRFMDEDIVVYRTRAGALRVVRPYCPHLGAHLGYGGTVEGENIVCPFHRFAYDPNGVCVQTGYGTRPPKAKLTNLPVREVNGAVLVWHHARGEGPQWEIRDIDMTGFPKPMTHTYTIIDHPQEIVENAVDIGHIGPIHHYRNVRVRNPFAVDGTRFTIGPAAERIFPMLGAVDVLFDVEAHGLGYISVTANIPRLRAAALFQAMSTPIDPCRVDLRFSVSIRLGAAGRPSSQTALFVSRLLTVALSGAFWRDLSLDFPIWENKAYLPRPRLAKGDGPIMPFRRWASQFYEQSELVGGARAPLSDGRESRPSNGSYAAPRTAQEASGQSH
ncbi:MAG TPA: Rieske 2Fe-2S domain-containing protein [Thermoleophilaceae bacterium]|nr:Rieske 2Fe-2S domain-containing protein [Thermoleophilaceae bacterium]